MFIGMIPVTSDIERQLFARYRYYEDGIISLKDAIQNHSSLQEQSLGECLQRENRGLNKYESLWLKARKTGKLKDWVNVAREKKRRRA